MVYYLYFLKQPTMPTVLQELKRPGAQTVASSDKNRPKGSKRPTLTLSRPGRPEMQFIDVGSRFLEMQGSEHRRRTLAATRRAQLKARRREARELTSSTVSG
jgi:hypothetical protein